MKLEARGKYAGVKVHLDKEEIEELLKDGSNSMKLGVGMSFLTKLKSKIASLLKENPNLLKDRTEEEIHAALSKELIESQEKLAAIGKKADWKKVKVEVAK